MNKFAKKILNQIRNVVFGVEDGLISTLGVLTGIAGGTNNKAIVILTGFVVVFVEASSMAVGTFLSSKSERQAKVKKLKEELEKIRENPEKEKLELVEFYKRRGYSEKEISMMVKRVSGSEKLILEEMANKELGISMKREYKTKRGAFYMFFSYMIGGSIPVLPYFFFSVNIGIVFSIILTSIGLFFLGYYKGWLTGVPKVKSGLEMFVMAAVVSGLGFAVGKIIGHFIGLVS
ncbi:MAG TPA: VIT1/CCC1 transporter family protein [Candidatus Bipolaricaulota bacterium]|nr:VIT1/CCC1 transporter family protein [Candidatus Bipolaricaulota bacterium]